MTDVLHGFPVFECGLHRQETSVKASVNSWQSAGKSVLVMIYLRLGMRLQLHSSSAGATPDVGHNLVRAVRERRMLAAPSG